MSSALIGAAATAWLLLAVILVRILYVLHVVHGNTLVLQIEIARLRKSVAS